MKQNSNLNNFQQLLFHTFPPSDELIFFGFTKMETGPKTAPRASKLGYKGGRAPQLSAQVTLATSRRGPRRCGLSHPHINSYYNTDKRYLFLFFLNQKVTEGFFNFFYFKLSLGN